MKRKELQALAVEQKILNRIYVIRGQRVMLDEDLAEMYGVETRRLNEQVKRNVKRFPNDFMFTLTTKEYESMKSQNATSSWGGRRKLPWMGRSLVNYNCISLELVRQRPAVSWILNRIRKTQESGGKFSVNKYKQIVRSNLEKSPDNKSGYFTNMTDSKMFESGGVGDPYYNKPEVQSSVENVEIDSSKKNKK